MPYLPRSTYRESLCLLPIPDATSASDGIMSAGDKSALDGLNLPRGVEVFSGGVSANIVFATPLATVSYVIRFAASLDSGGSMVSVAYSNKTQNGFTINVSAAFTGTIDWSVQLV